MYETKARHHAFKAMVLFLCGAAGYASIEMIWRGHTHWTMAVLGGVLFLLLGGLNEWFPWEMPLWLQCICGASIVYLPSEREFCTGLLPVLF